MKPLLTIENLSTGYPLKRGKKLKIHSGITTDVKAGEFIAVLGPNGAGKSTLLRTLSGFLKKLDGNIFYNGIELESYSIKELAKTVSVLLTGKPDDIYMTAYEIISLGRYPYGSLTGSFTEADIKAIEKAAGITYVKELLFRKFTTLSDGEKQRVMLARVLAQDTPLIIMDEPTAFIDSPGKTEITGLLKNISSNGKSVIAAIHDVELALNYADKIWLIGKNNFFETGISNDLINSGKINLVFDTEKVKFDKEKRSFYPVR